MAPILINQVHTSQSYFFQIHFNVIHPLILVVSSLWLSHQYPTNIPLLPIRAPYSAHRTLLD
jgi:hypothetical protein